MDDSNPTDPTDPKSSPHASPTTTTTASISQQHTPENAAPSIPEGGLHPQSCVLCAQRKVKCDRRDPTCANCVKAKATCEYRAPLPRGPRKRRHLNEDANDPQAIVEKLAKCEDLLRSLGISPDNVEAGKAYATPQQKQKAESEAGFALPRGRLMAEDGKLRYVENTLWTTVADEIPEDEQNLTDNQRHEVHMSYADENSQQAARSSNTFTNIASSMVIGMPLSGGQPTYTSLNVSRTEAATLWDVFMESVMPLTKIVHGPTLEKLHVFFLNRPDALSKRNQALLSGVYYSAVNAMSEQRCQAVFGQSKQTMSQTYFAMCASALIEAKFLGTIEIETLQGFVFFLLASRDKLDSRSVWTLVGIAVRIGQYIGLHYDGDELKISPFETEMRRRLWWQIGMLEAAVGELSGFGPSTFVTSSSTKPPTNLNDSDLDPNMEVLPPPRIGATDVMFTRLRTAAGNIARKHRLGSLFMGNMLKQSASQGITKTLQKIISEMEELIERDFLRYCDYLDPLHRLSSVTARVFLCRLRLKMYHPRRRKGAVEPLSEEEKAICFDNARRIIMYDNSILCDKMLEKYHWHILCYFQWDALLYVFHDLRQRDVFDRQVVQVWEEIEQSFKNHPALIDDQTKMLHIAVGQMCLKAWAIKEKAHAERDPADPIVTRPPGFIVSLREMEARRVAMHERRTAQERQPPGRPVRVPAPPQNGTTNGYEVFGYAPSLSEGTQVNTALDSGMMDLNFNFGLTNDFNFTFESAPVGQPAGGMAGGATMNANAAPGMEFDLWENMFSMDQTAPFGNNGGR